MVRFQYGVTTKASRNLAWQVFSDCRRWNEFANIYGEVNWRGGRPWEAGSRLEIEILQPVKTVVDHVITNASRLTKWVGSTTHSESSSPSGSALRSSPAMGRGCIPRATSFIPG